MKRGPLLRHRYSRSKSKEKKKIEERFSESIVVLFVVAVMLDGDDVVKLGAEALDLINKAIYFDTSGGNIIAACDYYDLAILNIDEGSDACT